MNLASTKTIRVLLVEDHPMVLEGLRAQLSSEPDIDVTGTATRGKEVPALIDEQRPHVIVIDIGLPDMDGIALGRVLQRTHPEASVIYFTAQTEVTRVHEAMLSGARGYLTKGCRHTLLARAIRSALDGGMTIEAGLIPEYLRSLTSSVESGDHSHSLSPRERQVLTMISKGFSNKLISAEINLAESTVKKYVYTLMSKLGASDRAHAAALGIKLGLIH